MGLSCGIEYCDHCGKEDVPLDTRKIKRERPLPAVSAIQDEPRWEEYWVTLELCNQCQDFADRGLIP